LPQKVAQGKIGFLFANLAEKAEISEKNFQEIMGLMISKSNLVNKMISASFLNDSTKKQYFQLYQERLHQLTKG